VEARIRKFDGEATRMLRRKQPQLRLNETIHSKREVCLLTCFEAGADDGVGSSFKIVKPGLRQSAHASIVARVDDDVSPVDGLDAPALAVDELDVNMDLR